MQALGLGDMMGSKGGLLSKSPRCSRCWVMDWPCVRGMGSWHSWASFEPKMLHHPESRLRCLGGPEP